MKLSSCERRMGDSVRLGPFQLEHPFILAPMAGITTSPYRRLMRRHRAALVISELVSAHGIEYSGQRSLDLLRFHEEERIVGLQIFGEDLKLLCKASQWVEKLGADFVDLNLGCPVPKVVKKGAGSALCRDPLWLGQILTAMVKSVQIPVTIKIRIGWDAESKNAWDVVQAATDAGVSWVAVHGRTRSQGYSGFADWDFMGDLKAKSSIPIVGNGDLTTPELALEKLKKYGMDAVMVGRGALRNPFIFEQAECLWRRGEGQGQKPLSGEDYSSWLQEQRTLLEEVYEPRVAMIHARKWIAWSSAGFQGCHEFRRLVFSTSDPETLWAESKIFFEKKTQARDLQFLAQPFLMGGHG